MCRRFTYTDWELAGGSSNYIIICIYHYVLQKTQYLAMSEEKQIKHVQSEQARNIVEYFLKNADMILVLHTCYLYRKSPL